MQSVSGMVYCNPVEIFSSKDYDVSYGWEENTIEGRGVWSGINKGIKMKKEKNKQKNFEKLEKRYNFAVANASECLNGSI